MQVKVKNISVLIAVAGVLVCCVGSAIFAAPERTGETLFKQYCAICHPDGGNIVNPAKTLHKKDRDANNVKTVNDIIQRMRNPGPGMSTFDQKTLSDADAKEIADYVLKTFSK